MKERAPFYTRDTISILETVNIATGQTTTLCELDYCIEAPNWTRDGGSLIYNALGKIVRYDLATGQHIPVESGFVNRCNNDHVLSPDGKSIAVSHHTVEDGQSRIYVLPLDGSGPPVLVTPLGPSYLHGWSPDGATLAYCAERGGEYDVYTIPVQGGEETQLTDVPGLSDGPEYTPDGRYLWFNSVRSGLMQLYRMRADGSEPVQMTSDDRNNWFGHVSPDGKQVAYISYAKGDVAPHDHPPDKNVEIRLMPAQGGESRVLVQLFGGQGTLNVNSWAPDSQRLAYVRYRKE